jgi:two-component system response regulator GlrR
MVASERTTEDEGEHCMPEAGKLSGEGCCQGLLVVDDEEEMRQEAADGLRAEGFPCWEADSAEAALAVLAREGVAIGVVVADLRMPGLSGLDLARELIPVRPVIEVILITGHGSRQDQVQAAELGVHEFLRKPFRLDDLVSAVVSACARVTAARGERCKGIEVGGKRICPRGASEHQR